MIVGPRVEFDPDHYPRIRYWDGEKEHYIYLHRLSAYAEGKLSSLWDDEHVHHTDCDSWNSRPENLEVVDPDEHARREPQVANLRAPPEEAKP